MIEVRTFEEDAATAAAFTNRVWAERYHNRMPVLDWTPEYLDWQLLSGPAAASRDFLVAAYHGGRLVGTLFAVSFGFQRHGEPFEATMGSWLTVDPGYRRHGIARLLAEEQRVRHRARNAKFMLGYGVIGSDGPSFWNARSDTHVLGSVGFWIRFLDYRRVASWSIPAHERVMTRMLGPLVGRPPRADSAAAVRPFQPSDLDACLELARDVERTADLGYRSSAAPLAHLLAGKVARTLVAHRDGRPAGFVNYHLLGMFARTRIDAAVVDLIAFGALSRRDRRRLLNAALADMARAGAAFAMALRIPTMPSAALVRAGFMPTPNESTFLFTVLEPGFSLDGVRAVHVYWR